MSASRIELARLALTGLRPHERRHLFKEMIGEAPASGAPKADGSFLLTQKQAATLLSVSRQTLFRWINAGTIRPVVINGLRRYRREDLENLSRTGTGGAS